MTIKEILKNEYVKWEDVKRAIKYHYPNDKNNYEELFYDLAKKKAMRAPSDEFIVITGGIDINTDWFKNYGDKYLEDLKTGDEEQYYNMYIEKRGDDISHSCSFIPWGKMINIPISPKTLNSLTMVDIVAHFIWEITYYGNEKQMKKHGEEIFKRVKDIKVSK